MPKITAVGRKRLERLATYLEERKFPKGKFHLNLWMGGYNSVHIPEEDAEFSRGMNKLSEAVLPDAATFEENEGGFITPIDCRTVGCAVGWGIAGIPSFRRAGFKFSRRGYVGGGFNSFSSAQIVYKGFEAGDAAVAFFGLPDDDIGSTFTALFMPEAYSVKQQSNPKAVAKRIRGALAADAKDELLEYVNKFLS